MYIGKGGYWEGRAGGNQGWFPALAIKERGEQEEEEEVDYRESEKRGRSMSGLTGLLVIVVIQEVDCSRVVSQSKLLSRV